jgi:hypothetical protein
MAIDDSSDPKLLILSAGYSGSRYTATILDRCGIEAGHEAWFGLTKYPIPPLVESSWMGLPPVEAGVFTGSVCHQTRHPLDVLDTLLTGILQRPDARDYLTYRIRHCGLHLRSQVPDDYDDTAAWNHWHVRWLADWIARCEQAADWTYRVEDFEAAHVWRMAREIGVAPPDRETIRWALFNTPRNVNQHVDRRRVVTWEDLPSTSDTRFLREWAGDMGYGD